MEHRPSPWPQATNSLLPNILFKFAAEYPGMTYAMFPINPTKIQDGYRKITFGEVANAVHATAWWIDANVGKLAEERKDGKKALVYIGPNDIRYAVLCLGSVVAGYKMLFPSPRYGADALSKLLETVNAETMLVPETTLLPVVSEVLEKRREMRVLRIPSVEELLTSKTSPYPFTKTFAEHKNEPLVCLPILWTHSWVHSRAQEFLLPDIQNTDTPLLSGSGSGSSKALFYFPAFHASGVIGMVLFPLLRGVVPVYPPSWTTPSEAIEGALAVLDILAAEKEGDSRGKAVDSISVPPPFIEYLGAHPDLLEKLSQGAETAIWAGGSVSRSAGDAVAYKMNVVNALASTEMGAWPSISQAGASTGMKDGLWEYMSPHPALNMRFDPISETPEGTAYEAVVVRNDGLQWDGYVQPLFKVYESVKEKRLGDLFVQHQNDSTLWKHYGRADDLLVFITNEKFHPAAAEQRLVSHPDIAECMLVGTRRPTASLILRLQDGGKILSEDVWTLVEEVNLASPVYARVEREMVIVVDRPFERTAKGSVQKRGMLELYKEEVDGLYERWGHSNAGC